ncbi:MAG: putative ABC transporter permease [Ruminococcus sp.]|nr:putative ABC transporter permease [Ruminococcus sp.]
MGVVYEFLTLELLFAVGCVLGWGIEVFYRRFKKENVERVWVNPGFLVGPYLPLYGFGLVALYLMAKLEQFIPVDDQTLRQTVLFVFMALAMTLIELIAGEIFIIRMHIKLWDYSNMRFNYKGVICLRFSVFWWLLGAMYYFVIHPRILAALSWFSHNLLFSAVIGFFYGVFTIDLCYSFKLTARIRRFAEENQIVVRLEELKRSAAVAAREAREKHRFILNLRYERLPESLKDYLEKQMQQIETYKKKAEERISSIKTK